MCGRFCQVIKHDQLQSLQRELKAELNSVQMLISFNVAPTHSVMAILAKGDRRYGGFFRWGLVPSWMKELPRTALINVRSETIHSKPSFKASFIRRRALVPINGFYEWQAPGKIPYYIYPAEGGLLHLATIYDLWEGADGSYLPSLGIITAPANDFMSRLHHRMPVVITGAAIDPWLDPDMQDIRLAREMLQPAPEGMLDCHRVSPAVNKVSNNYPELILEDTHQEELHFL